MGIYIYTCVELARLTVGQAISRTLASAVLLSKDVTICDIKDFQLTTPSGVLCL